MRPNGQTLVVLLAGLLVGCGPWPNATDAGIPADGGADAGNIAPDAGPVSDGGQMVGVGACVSPQAQKFIARFVSYSDGHCVEASFRAWDGGFVPRFADSLAAPAGVALFDARYWPCGLGRIEQADGGLNPAASEVEYMEGAVAFDYVVQGRPITYRFDAGLIVVNHTSFWVDGDETAVSETCKAE